MFVKLPKTNLCDNIFMKGLIKNRTQTRVFGVLMARDWRLSKTTNKLILEAFFLSILQYTDTRVYLKIISLYFLTKNSTE